MLNFEERETKKVYNFTLESESPILVSLTDSQVRLILWLQDQGYEMGLVEMNNSVPIEI